MDARISQKNEYRGIKITRVNSIINKSSIYSYHYYFFNIIIILLKQDYKIKLANNKMQMAWLTSWLVVG